MEVRFPKIRTSGRKGYERELSVKPWRQEGKRKYI
jgi:hypothetical protein